MPQLNFDLSGGLIKRVASISGVNNRIDISAVIVAADASLNNVNLLTLNNVSVIDFSNGYTIVPSPSFDYVTAKTIDISNIATPYLNINGPASSLKIRPDANGYNYIENYIPGSSGFGTAKGVRISGASGNSTVLSIDSSGFVDVSGILKIGNYYFQSDNTGVLLMDNYADPFKLSINNARRGQYEVDISGILYATRVTGDIIDFSRNSTTFIEAVDISATNNVQINNNLYVYGDISAQDISFNTIQGSRSIIIDSSLTNITVSGTSNIQKLVGTDVSLSNLTLSNNLYVSNDISAQDISFNTIQGSRSIIIDSSLTNITVSGTSNIHKLVGTDVSLSNLTLSNNLYVAGDISAQDISCSTIRYSNRIYNNIFDISTNFYSTSGKISVNDPSGAYPFVDINCGSGIMAGDILSLNTYYNGAWTTRNGYGGGLFLRSQTLNGGNLYKKPVLCLIDMSRSSNTTYDFLTFDASNQRLGILQSNPAYTLDVSGVINANRIGIGIQTSPATTLVVKSNPDTNQYISGLSVNNANMHTIISNENGSNFGTIQVVAGGDSSTIGTDYNTTLKIQPLGGNVGIGKSPTTTFDVSGSIKTNTGLTIGNTSVSTLDVTSTSTPFTTNEQSKNALILRTGSDASDQTLYFGVYKDPTNNVNNYSYIQSVRYGVNTGDLLLNRRGGDVIMGSGTSSVGIGKTPTMTLDVSGNTNIGGNLNFNTTPRYNNIKIPGGNVNGYIYGAFNSFTDGSGGFGSGLHLGANYYANDPGTGGNSVTDVCDNGVYGTSRLSIKPSSVEMYTALNGSRPTTLGFLLTGLNRVGLGGNNNPSYTLDVSGTINASGAVSSAGSKPFIMKHPLIPNKELVHNAIEGPRCDLIYRGTAKLVNGTSTVNIDKDCVHEPDCAMTEGTFESLCCNPVKYLHNNDSFSRVRGSIVGNILTIICEDSNCTDSIDWMVVAERKDNFIKQWDRTNENGYLQTEHDVQPEPQVESQSETLDNNS